MSKTTRQRLIEFLAARQSATAEEVARLLQTGVPNARYHLAALLSQGTLEIAGEIPPPGRGRPRLVYRLRLPGKEHNLDRLASALLHSAQSLSPEARQVLLKQVAHSLASGGKEVSPSPAARLNAAVRHLNRMNYQARWEAHVQTPRIVLGRCPYAAIWHQHPELCQVDAFLLQELLDHPVQLTACQQPNPHGVPQCIFLMK